MPLDRYVTLGRSGLRASPFCMGCMTFGEDWGWGSSAKASEAICKGESVDRDIWARNDPERKRSNISPRQTDGVNTGNRNTGNS